MSDTGSAPYGTRTAEPLGGALRLFPTAFLSSDGEPIPLADYESADAVTDALSEIGGDAWIQAYDGRWLRVSAIVAIGEGWFPYAERRAVSPSTASSSGPVSGSDPW